MGKEKEPHEDFNAERDVTLLQKLFDGANDDNIFLFDEDGNEIELEQIAAINHEGSVYAILHPTDAPEEEVLVFKIDTEDEESMHMIEDEKLVAAILEKATASEANTEAEAETDGG